MTGYPRNESRYGTGASRVTGGFTILELLAVLVTIALLIGMLLPAMRRAGPAAYRSQCRNNLKQIVIALRNYEETYHAFPPAYTVDANGKRLHSWRTLILPFVEQGSVYEQIDLSKAWDDPANAEAFRTIIQPYICAEATSPPTHTTYLAVVAENSCLLPTRSRPLSEVADPGKSLLIIEVDSEHAVHWMSPTDADEASLLALNPETKLPHDSGMHAALVDGSVHFLHADLPVAERRALISVNAADKQPLESNHGY